MSAETAGKGAASADQAKDEAMSIEKAGAELSMEQKDPSGILTDVTVITVTTVTTGVPRPGESPDRADKPDDQGAKYTPEHLNAPNAPNAPNTPLTLNTPNAANTPNRQARTAVVLHSAGEGQVAQVGGQSDKFDKSDKQDATDGRRRGVERARRLKGLAGALSLAFTVGVMSSPARASGIPTVDAAALTQRIQTILQLNEQYQTLKDQYSKMKEQFSELQHIKGNLNGIDGVMEALGALDETLRIGEGISDFAATADSLLAPQGSGAGVLAGDDKARQVYNAAGLGARCEGYTRADLKAICQRQGAGQAKLTAQIYESLSKLKDHFDAVDRIYSRAQGAQTQKAMTDALEAMQTQKALIALEQSRVQSYVQGMAALQVTNKLQQEAAVKNMFVMKPEQATSARARQILRTN